MGLREYIREAWESDGRKVYQCLSLFCFLAVTYAVYLAMLLRAAAHAGPDQAVSIIGPLAILYFVSALPFVFLAYADEDWCSNDAAPVCVAAWIAACVGISFQCKLCALGLCFTFFPFILSALLAHGFGTVCRFLKTKLSAASR
jgi:presenilin-like A22 family membrane protease